MKPSMIQFMDEKADGILLPLNQYFLSGRGASEQSFNRVLTIMPESKHPGAKLTT
jgi:hypothetical protein